MQRDSDILERMGTFNSQYTFISFIIRNLTNILAQAVLLVISVTNVETKAIRKLTRRGSKL